MACVCYYFIDAEKYDADLYLMWRGGFRMGEGGSPGGGGGGGGARLSHTSEKHPRAILAELSALRRHRELCDVVLNVANRKLFAHRSLLHLFLFRSLLRSRSDHYKAIPTLILLE